MNKKKLMELIRTFVLDLHNLNYQDPMDGDQTEGIAKMVLKELDEFNGNR